MCGQSCGEGHRASAGVDGGSKDGWSLLSTSLVMLAAAVCLPALLLVAGLVVSPHGQVAWVIAVSMAALAAVVGFGVARRFGAGRFLLAGMVLVAVGVVAVCAVGHEDVVLDRRGEMVTGEVVAAPTVRSGAGAAGGDCVVGFEGRQTQVDGRDCAGHGRGEQIWLVVDPDGDVGPRGAERFFDESSVVGLAALGAIVYGLLFPVAVVVGRWRRRRAWRSRREADLLVAAWMAAAKDDVPVPNDGPGLTYRLGLNAFHRVGAWVGVVLVLLALPVSGVSTWLGWGIGARGGWTVVAVAGPVAGLCFLVIWARGGKDPSITLTADGVSVHRYRTRWFDWGEVLGFEPVRQPLTRQEWRLVIHLRDGRSVCSWVPQTTRYHPDPEFGAKVVAIRQWHADVSRPNPVL